MKTRPDSPSSHAAPHVALILLLAGTAWHIPPGAAYADTFQQLKVVVNQLDGANVPKPEDRQKEMNDILKQCEKFGVRMRVTVFQVKTNQNPMDPSAPTNAIAPGGRVPNDAAGDKLDQVALAGEVKNGGYKFWVAKDVNNDTNVNGTTRIGTPSSVVREQSGVNGDARTWTHEMAHGLGLGHDESNTNSLMFPGRTVGTNGAPAGTALSEAECKCMKTNFVDKLHPTTAKTEEQTNQPPAKSSSHAITDWFDFPDFPKFTPADLGWLQLVTDYFLVDSTARALYLTIHVNCPTVHPACVYQVLLDTDNDLATGMGGYDVSVEHRVLTPTAGEVVLVNLRNGMMEPIGPLEIATTYRAVSSQTNGYQVPVGTRLASRVPIELLGPLAPEIVVRAESFDGIASDELGPELVLALPPPEPVLTLTPSRVSPGMPVALMGTGFAPLTPYRVILDDAPVGEGQTSPLGEVGFGLLAPQLPPGDYLVDVIADAADQVQIAVLRILDTVGLHIQRVGEDVLISFTTQIGPVYIVEFTESLANPVWTELARIPGTGEVVVVPDSLRASPMRFYRWRQE